MFGEQNDGEILLFLVDVRVGKFSLTRPVLVLLSFKP